MIIYCYELSAKADGVQALKAALASLSAALGSQSGFLGSETLANLDDERQIIFLERWESLAAHDAAGAAIPPAVMTAMKAALDERPRQRIMAAASP